MWSAIHFIFSKIGNRGRYKLLLQKCVQNGIVFEIANTILENEMHGVLNSILKK